LLRSSKFNPNGRAAGHDRFSRNDLNIVDYPPLGHVFITVSNPTDAKKLVTADSSNAPPDELRGIDSDLEAEEKGPSDERRFGLTRRFAGRAPRRKPGTEPFQFGQSARMRV
jgi:hypothetical protein